ncbi:MAG TPA: hypothetical protein VFD92_26990 [Candidatus Binatia bacterium]|nr:hypothetical protein [Candidatus Binatia bacterium]
MKPLNVRFAVGLYEYRATVDERGRGRCVTTSGELAGEFLLSDENRVVQWERSPRSDGGLPIARACEAAVREAALRGGEGSGDGPGPAAA